MKNEALVTYLNDHLAGAVGATEMIERLIETYEKKPLVSFFRELLQDVTWDIERLRQIMRDLEIEESAIRKAGAWVAEKFGRFKIRLEEGSSGDPALMLALEALVMGIRGKQLLWRALATVQQYYPALQNHDLKHLEKRALEQVERVENLRLEVSSRALAPGTGENT